VIARAVLLATALALPPVLPAQRVIRARVTPIVRTDVLVDRGVTQHVGGGAVIPAGYQLRVALEGGAGLTRRDGEFRPSARVDATARFLFDPFRERRIGLSAGGGAGMRWERGERPRPVALVLVGVQGAALGRWVRGVDLGIGGGVRLGLTLGRPVPGRR
jgi:hypothetical protein